MMVALAIVAVVQVVLDLTVVLIPVAIFLLVRWSLLAVVGDRGRHPGGASAPKRHAHPRALVAGREHRRWA